MNGIWFPSAESAIARMSRNIETLFYVDFDRDMVKPYKLMGKSDSESLKEFDSISYDDFVEEVLMSHVYGEYRAGLAASVRYEFLNDYLRDRDSYYYSYSAEYNNGIYGCRIKVVNFDDSRELHRAVFGIMKDGFKENVELYHDERKILVVEDNDINREMLADILAVEYTVLEAVNGKQALDILKEQAEEISVIISDLEMPVCDGYQFLKIYSSMKQYTNIPVLITTASSNIKTEIECLKMGAADFIVKPYNHEVILNRVKSFTRLKEASAMLTHLEKDELTGLYTKEFFYKYANEYIKEHKNSRFNIICSDVENFKLVNDRYGMDNGDETLAYLAEGIPHNVRGIVIGGRINGDVFVFLQDAGESDGLSEELVEKIINGSAISVMSVKFGIYPIAGDIPVSSMVDRAMIAVRHIKNQYGTNVAYYDEKVRESIMQEQQIVESMETSLKNGEFIVYYQPKRDIINDITGGAEALVRWIHPKLGFMNPGVFIPIFETNGFISQLDNYIWDQVCITLGKWRDEGKPLVPISVNVSRRDFERDDLAERIISKLDKRNLPHELLHVEVTESAYSDNQQKIDMTIEKLHEAGIIIELDDFGTGYSSLAVLNDMKIDVLKLDMSLVRSDNPDSGRSTLEFATLLGRMLKVKMVAEGVETQEQSDRVKSLGCDYVQGYYYSRPLPVEEFEQYLLDNTK